MSKIMYLRAARNQHPVGCVAFTYGDKGSISYQLSMLNPKSYEVPGKEITLPNGNKIVTKPKRVRDGFDKAYARNTAAARLVDQPINLDVAGDINSWATLELIMKDISERVDTLPGRASKTAKAWLSNVQKAKEEKAKLAAAFQAGLEAATKMALELQKRA